MATYTDSYNNGNPNILNGTDSSGDTFNLGKGLDWVTGAGNDTINISGGFPTPPYKNTFSCADVGTNVINLIGYETDLWIGEFSPSDHIQIINGDSTSRYSYIWAAEYPNPGTGDHLDFSATSLNYISAIYASDYGDTIRGSGQYITGTTNPIPIYGGSGDDIFYESGADTTTESAGADLIDGRAGYNTYYASGAESTYAPEYNVGGTDVFHSGSSWSFDDAAGYRITLTNIQEVVFTDQTVYSTDSLMEGSGENTIASNATNGSAAGRPLAALQGTSAAGLTPAEVAALTPADLTALTPAALGALSAPDIAVIAPASLMMLTPAQFLEISPTAVAALSTSQMAALTPAQVGGMSVAQTAALTPADVGMLTPAQAVALSPRQIAAFASPQIAALSTTTLAALPSAGADAFTGAQLSAMTAGQLAVLHF